MKNKDIKVATIGQIKTSTGLTLMDGLCLLVPLLIFLAVLGWATWEIRSVNPLAFVMFAGLMAATLVLAIADVWSRRGHSFAARSLKPASESVCLPTPISKQIKLSRPLKEVHS